MSASLGGVLSFLRRLVPDGPAAEDGQLLARFLQGEGSAFTVLVGRYAPLVWGVCKRTLGTTPDAEDAFQATFVVLVQKAASLTDGRPLGPWLYRVASRTASKARARAGKRQTQPLSEVGEPASRASSELHQRELGRLLDEELGRLPERYREPLVLCYLEGLTNEQAAQRLACPTGTVLSRLSRGREQLRERLQRRGVDLQVLLTPATLAPPVPASLLTLVSEAGLLLRVGAIGGVSSTALILAKGVMFSMLMRKLELMGAVCLVLALTATGAGWWTHRLAAAAQPSPAVALSADQDQQAKPADKQPEKPTTDEVKKVPPPVGHDEVAKLLNKRIDFHGTQGILDPQLKFGEVIAEISRLHRVPIEVNELAFQGEGIDDVMQLPVAEKSPLPAMKGVSLRRVLDKVLSRVPMPSGPVILVRQDHLEITTGMFARAELNLLTTPVPFRPLVVKKFQNVPLKTALEELAEENGLSIAIDVAVQETAADTQISARFVNTPVDAAVNVLVDMAGLDVARIENVLYVTTSKKAEALNELQERKLHRATGTGL